VVVTQSVEIESFVFPFNYPLNFAAPGRDGGGKNRLNGLVIRAEMCYIAPPPRRWPFEPEARL
jgi:hypothetical protein